MAQFEKRANQILRELARDEDVQLIDAEVALAGRRALFGDLVHFNDEGATRMAELLAAGITGDSNTMPPRTMTETRTISPQTTEPARSHPRLSDL
jgi:hypothetical protein